MKATQGIQIETNTILKKTKWAKLKGNKFDKRIPIWKGSTYICMYIRLWAYYSSGGHITIKQTINPKILIEEHNVKLLQRTSHAIIKFKSTNGD